MKEYFQGRVISDKRLPIAAGLFYEAAAEKLRTQLEWGFRHPLGPGKLPSEQPGHSEAVVVPHGGFFVAGPLYAHGVNAAAGGKWDLVVVVGPNHTGVGPSVSVYPRGSWVTPLGEVPVDEEASRLLAEEAGAELDIHGHLYEHSVEVVLPWLQYSLGNGWRLVAVSMYDSSPEAARRLAEAVSSIIERLGHRTLVVVSANLTSYLGYEEARRKDRVLLDAVLGLQEGGVYQAALREEIPSCSVGVLEFFVSYSRLRSLKPRLLAYATSGDITRERDVVTGYAALAAERVVEGE